MDQKAIGLIDELYEHLKTTEGEENAHAAVVVSALRRAYVAGNVEGLAGAASTFSDIQSELAAT